MRASTRQPKTELRVSERAMQSELRYRRLFEAAQDGILILDALTGAIIDVNPFLIALLGFSYGEFHGKHLWEIGAFKDIAASKDAFDELQRKGYVRYDDLPLQTRDGRRIQVEFISNVYDVSGAAVIQCNIRDITERKAAERTLIRLNRALRTLSAGNEALVRNDNEAALYSETCRVIVEIGGYRIAWVGIPKHEGGRRIVSPVAWAGPTPECIDRSPKIEWGESVGAQGLCGRAIKSGEQQVIQNLPGEPGMAPWNSEANELGFASAAAFPLKVDSEVFAVLAIYGGEPDRFDADEVKLLQELANDLAFGIRAARDRSERAAMDQRWLASLETTVGAIAHTIEVRDPYTTGHQQRTARLAVAIARKLGLPEHDIQGLYLAGIIHDIGKINIPAEILNKSGKLSKLERGLIEEHAEAGYDIVKGVDFPWPIAEMVRQHHERLDGSGYPHGLKGDAILPQAKILTVADVVEAMMSHRPYRPALGIDAALAEIEKNKGLLFDTAAVDACIALFRQQHFDFDAPSLNHVAALEAAPSPVLPSAA
jgi:PAS domain S-box-containing protein/putative nucleotidyltransferase with HDIG domain